MNTVPKAATESLKERVVSGERSECCYSLSVKSQKDFYASGRACHAYLRNESKALLEVTWLAIPQEYSVTDIEEEMTCTNEWEPEDVLDLMKSKDCPPVLKATYEFQKWLLNDPLFGQAFITKDVDKAFVEGAVINMDVQNELGIHSLIASRRPHEFIRRVVAWKKLVDLGLNPRAAHVLAEGCYRDSINQKTCYYWGAYTDGHECFDLDTMSLENLFAVRDGRVPRPKREWPLRKGYLQMTSTFCTLNRRQTENSVYNIVNNLWKTNVPVQKYKVSLWGGHEVDQTKQTVDSLNDWAAHIYDIARELGV